MALSYSLKEEICTEINHRRSLASVPILSFCHFLLFAISSFCFIVGRFVIFSSSPLCHFVLLKVTWTPFSRDVLVDSKEE